MDIVYRRGKASVAEIRGDIADHPSYSAVRMIVSVLERKGYLRHTLEGRKYEYAAVTSRKKAMQGALRQLLDTYFEGSLQQAVAALVELKGGELSTAQLAQLAREIRRKLREEGG